MNLERMKQLAGVTEKKVDVVNPDYKEMQNDIAIAFKTGTTTMLKETLEKYLSPVGMQVVDYKNDTYELIVEEANVKSGSSLMDKLQTIMRDSDHTCTFSDAKWKRDEENLHLKFVMQRAR